MTDVPEAPDLDKLFGFTTLPLGNTSLKVRVLLSRKQTRDVARLRRRLVAISDDFTKRIQEAGGDEPTAEALDRITQEAEDLEEELVQVCIDGIAFVCIDPPLAVLAALTVEDLTGLFARVSNMQGEAAARLVVGETGHPTPASSAS